MKIEDKRFSELCLFHELMQGEVFVNCDETIFMKTSEVETKIGDADFVYNTVYLETGTLAHFEDDEEVRTINARVVIQ